MPDFNWAAAWPALCKPNRSLKQGIYCQYHIPIVWVWMPLTCAVCKHHQAESESLQVLTVWSSLQKYIGGFYVLIKHSNINMIFACSQLLSSEHSQLGLRKFFWFQLNTNVLNFMVTIWPVSFLLSLICTSPLLLCSSGENSFPGFTVGLTCLLGSPLTQWLMVRRAASLDLVNIRNYSQISVISDSLWAEKWDSLPDTKASGLG